MKDARLVGLHRRQQLAGFLASAIPARTALRAMLVDSLRLTGDHAEQFAEIFHETTPDLRRDPKSIKQRSKLLRCRTSLARTSLARRPVEQDQVIRRRYRQESLVAATSALFVNTRSCHTRSAPQFHRSQMTATIVARVSDAGLLSWLVSQRNYATVRNQNIASVLIGRVCIN